MFELLINTQGRERERVANLDARVCNYRLRMGLAMILLGACMHLVAAVSQQFPRSPPLHAPPDIPPLLAPLIRNSDSSCGLLSRKWKDPRPSLSQPLKSSQRDDVIVFGCQSTTLPLSLSLASNLSLGVAPFTLQEAGNRFYEYRRLLRLCARCV